MGLTHAQKRSSRYSRAIPAGRRKLSLVLANFGSLSSAARQSLDQSVLWPSQDKSASQILNFKTLVID